MHRQIDPDPALLSKLVGKTVIVTGGAAGIGAATVKLCNDNGANVVIADLAHTQSAAETAIQNLPHPEKALFAPANILDWQQMNGMFKDVIARFGKVDVVIANAGTIESAMVLDLDNVESDGEPLEPREGYKVIDINLKGTLNTLKLAMHYMNKSANPERPGSIVLVASTSGYFGGTGVSAYIASKHGVVGLLRASQVEARKRNKFRINAVAPFYTPTAFTVQYSDRWPEGQEANTPQDVAETIVSTALEESFQGTCVLAAGKYKRELEHTRAALTPDWIGSDLAAEFAKGMKFFESIGGYPLPKR